MHDYFNLYYHYNTNIKTLNDAINTIKTVENRIYGNINVQYIHKSVIHIDKIKHNTKYNYIYSMGLFDYLPTPVAQKLAKQLYNLLAPGGLLLIGNYHVNNPYKLTNLQ